MTRKAVFTRDDARDLRAISEDYSHPPTRDFLNSLAARIEAELLVEPESELMPFDECPVCGVSWRATPLE